VNAYQSPAAQAYQALWREVLSRTTSMLGWIGDWLAKDRRAAPPGPVQSIRSPAP
jgi:hypothetical protein